MLPGVKYKYILPDGMTVPDPASRFNPEDVHGPSELIDPRAYEWRETAWRGRPWEDAVVYELHVGAFTPEGTFAAAARKLPELAALGITVIELMPVADFPGRRNWGYDGVLPFAPDASYGRPEELKALIDTAHAHGIMVLLDVVYNHFGPEGNYLHAYCKEFFDPARHTPWGAAIDFQNPTVREFFVHNALYWLEEYRFDGLRLDAVHAIEDRSLLIEDIHRAVCDGPARERQVHVVLENDGNQARYLGAQATAQWNDDVHHALHVILTGERDGYYADYADAPLQRLGRALAEGFSYQGEPSVYRGGAPRGESSRHLPPASFVAFLQNHDQVGNRPSGERMHSLSQPERERAALACLLLAPQVPMLFMGEEYAASTPFPYFCDFGPELARAVSEGRKREFPQHATFVDPNSPETFNDSKLDWEEREEGAHGERLRLVRELLDLRHKHIVPRLPGAHSGRIAVVNGALQVEWRMGDDAVLKLSFGNDHGETLWPGDTVYRADGIQVALEQAHG